MRDEGIHCRRANKSSLPRGDQTYRRPYAKLGHCWPQLKYYPHKTSQHIYFLSEKAGLQYSEVHLNQINSTTRRLLWI